MKKLIASLTLLPCVVAFCSALDPSNFFYRTSPAGAPLKIEPVYYAPRPSYPLEARQNGWEGEGLFELHIGPGGRVESVKILKSTGHPTLDKAASEGLREWRFRANSIDLVRVPLEYKITALVRPTGHPHGYGLKARGDCEKAIIFAHARG
ncbi:MAG TPA: energy transducer TonB [Candidatus Udaeobacter sp.]|nr:energy transducer TonB [Candidatus Udaeobacter sp.]